MRRPLALARYALFLGGVPILLLLKVVRLDLAALALVPLSAYIYGVSAAAAAQLGFRRFWIPMAFAASALLCAQLPWYAALIPIFVFSASLAFFAAVWPALLFGRWRLPFAALLTVLSLLFSAPVLAVPLGYGLLIPPPLAQYLGEDPLYTRYNWIRYVMDMSAYSLALYVTRKIAERRGAEGRRAP
ncbi:MAG: hypothetical protein ACP5I3_11405 [Thermoproteus sp.]